EAEDPSDTAGVAMLQKSHKMSAGLLGWGLYGTDPSGPSKAGYTHNRDPRGRTASIRLHKTSLNYHQGSTRMKFLRIILAASTLTSGTHIAVAQQQPAGAPGAGAPANEEVIITGTRRTDRTVTDSASPIDIITSVELVAQPAANMLDEVKNVVPSFFVGQNTISDASSLVRAPSLRGLPGDEILVMLNGKRLNRSALV